jgi:hypothetical protein
LLQASEHAPLHTEAAAVKAPPAKKAAVRKLTQASAPAKTNVPAAPAARAVEQQAACSSAVSAVAPASTPMQLTEEQKARIERNRQQALAIRATKADGSAASCGGGGGGGGGDGSGGGGDKRKGQECDKEIPVQATAEKENASADVQGGSAIAEVPAQDQPEHEKAQIANPKKRKVTKMLNAVVGHAIFLSLECPNCAVCALLFAQPPPSVEHIDLSLDWWRTELSRIEKEIKKNISVPMLKHFLKVYTLFVLTITPVGSRCQ